jgi:hypothetical protein
MVSCHVSCTHELLLAAVTNSQSQSQWAVSTTPTAPSPLPPNPRQPALPADSPPPGTSPLMRQTQQVCSHDFDCVQRHTSSRVKNWAQALTRRQKRFQSSLDHGTIADMSALIAPMTLRHLRAAAATSNHANPAIYLPPPRRSQMGASAHLMILAAHLRVARLAQSSPLLRRPHAPDVLRARESAISLHTALSSAESATQRRENVRSWQENRPTRERAVEHMEAGNSNYALTPCT